MERFRAIPGLGSERKNRRALSVLTLCLLASSALVSRVAHGGGTPESSSEWDRFRGPNGSGISEQVAIPERLNPAYARWKTEILPGFSSPVLGSSCLFATGGAKIELYTYCLDPETGEQRWRSSAPPRPAESPGPNSIASSSPATDGEHVYVFFEHFGLISYDSEGRERWTRKLGPFRTPYGMGSSPILIGDRLVMLCDQDVGSFLLALDKNTGEELWRIPRPRATHGFSTPVSWTADDGTVEVIISESYEVVGYDLETGERRWWVQGMAWQAKSVPVIDGDQMFVHSWMASPAELGVRTITLEWQAALEQYDHDGNGQLSKPEVAEPFTLGEIWFLYDLGQDGELSEEDWNFALARGKASNGLFAIELGGRGDVSETHVKWQYKKSLPNIPSPLVYRGIVYVLKEGGVLTALDAVSGEAVKVGRIAGAEDPYFASPLAGDGRLITASKDGHLAVIRAGKDWEVLSVTAFDGEIWATPAAGNGSLFVRTQQAIYAFDAKKP